MDNSQLEPESPQVVQKKESSPMRWVVAGIVVVLLAAISMFAAWKWIESESLKSELTAVKTERDTLKNQTELDEDIPARLTSVDVAKSLQGAYGRSIVNAVDLSASDRATLGESLKKYYKITALPAGWQVMVAFKDDPTQGGISNPLGALVFWPASSTKPPGVIRMTQISATDWTVLETYN